MIISRSVMLRTNKTGDARIT